tara:strand:- start:5293 stop:7398 length:2106 start_codon:yes stop_codon:yes gene_type:complete
MDTKDKPELIQLLVISNQFHLVNKLLSALREDGIELKAFGANDKAGLIEQLKLQSWDLVLCCEDAGISLASAQETIHDLGLELPIIFLADEDSKVDAAELLNSGIRDFLPITQIRHIQHAIRREVDTHQLINNHRLLALNFKELEKRQQTLLNSTTQALAYIQEGMHLYCNESYAKLFAFPSQSSIEQTPLLDLFHNKSRTDLKKFLSNKIEEEQSINLVIGDQHAKNNEMQYEVELTFLPISFNGQSCFQLIVKAATGNSAYAEKISAVNAQDLLTRLYNKNYFLEKIEQAISRAIKQQQLASLLIVQINEFLDIKSTIGLSNANQVLNDIAKFLRKSVQKKFAAARLGDYEFGLLINECSPLEAVELGNFIKSKINNHITSAALPSLQLSCSIGIATINGHALDNEDLLAKARINLNTNIGSNKSSDNYRIGKAREHTIDEMAAYIDLALRENRFKLLFQPIVSLKGEVAHEYEVLSRMQDSEKNDIPPSEYMAIANLNGMGEELDKVIITQALDVLQNSNNKSVRLIINLTNNTLVSKTFLPWFADSLQTAEISTDRIIFQISETHICNNLDYCIQFCEGLNQLGLLSIVCHYGCLVDPGNYLEAIRPAYVKLDRTLVRDIRYSQHHQNELKRLISGLHTKNYKVVVPQVEDPSALPTLWKLDVDYVQGYYLEKPSQTMDYEFNQNHEITLNAPPPNQ